MTKTRKHEIGWLLAAIVATWRTTSILHHEGVLTPLRRFLGVVDGGYVDQSEWEYPDTFFGRLFRCFDCLSVWAGGFTVLLYFICPPLLLVLAFSAVVIWLQEVYEYLFYE